MRTSTSRSFGAGGHPVRAGRSLALAALSAALLSSLTVGCTTKNYVRSQTAPIVQNVNDLDAKTAADHNAIANTDEKAQAGINGAMSAADRANQHALAAGASADAAQRNADEAAHRVDSLAGVIANLDQYKPVAEISVTFAFDKAVLTPADKQQLDAFAASLNSTRGYILQVTGGTDSIGNAQYNYALSQRRADAVVQYLSVKYQVPPHKFYLVGIGKDQQIADDKTAAGRAKNRRVEVQLLSNMTNGTAAGSATAGAVHPQ
jgi:outer membrane protein OmpA-like peptidoglycan-associated protein